MLYDFYCTHYIYHPEKIFSYNVPPYPQAIVSTLRDVDEATTAISELSISRDVARLSEVAELSDGAEDDDNGKHPHIQLLT